MQLPIRNIGTACFGYLLYLCGFLAAEETKSPTIITFRTTAEVEAGPILVDDIAVLNGGNPSRNRQLAKLDIDDAPQPGRKLVIRSKQVEFRLLIAGLPHDSFLVQPNSRVLVTRRTYTLPPEQIVAAAKQVITERLPWKPDEYTLTATGPVRPITGLPVPPEQVALKAELRSHWPPQRTIQLTVQVVASADIKATVPITIQLQRFSKTVIATRPIKRGQVLGAADLHVERRDVTDETSYFTSTRSLLGKMVRVPVLPLHLIRPANVTEPIATQSPFIRIRDRVRIVANAGGLRVSTLGEAMEAGRKGQVIQVRNINSKKILQARVLSRQEVIVATTHDTQPRSKLPATEVANLSAEFNLDDRLMSAPAAPVPMLRRLPPLENTP